MNGGFIMAQMQRWDDPGGGLVGNRFAHTLLQEVSCMPFM